MRCVLAGALFAFAAAAQAAGGVAFVADISGVATIEGDGRLVFLAELPAGTRLLLGTHARVAVTYVASGSEFSAKGPGEFLVAAEALTAQKGPQPIKRDALVLGDSAIVARVSQSATASLRMRGIVPAASASMILFPSDTRIATLQPMLRLREGASPAGAMATVLDEDGKPLWSGSIGRGSVRLPVKLAARSRYSWKVTTPSGVAEEARFETPSSEDLARLQRAQGKGRTFTDRVQQAIVLQDLGARQEAREAWAALARERPDLPELASLAR